MISFFRVNTVYKFFILFFLFLALRLAALSASLPWLAQEWKWVLVGQRLQEGFILYAETIDNIAPLSALVYWLLYSLFGSFHLPYHIIAALLVFIQALQLNEVFRARQVFLEYTQIPALLYLVLMSSFPDFLVLSPALMANTFIIIALRFTFLHIAEKRRYNAVFEIGAYLGIASLFYLPSLALLPVPILAFLSFTNTKFQDYLLMIFAFLFPMVGAFIVFFQSNSEYALYLFFLESVFYLKPVFLIPPAYLGLIFALPFLLSLWNILRFGSYRRYSNYQIKCFRIMFIWIIFAILSPFLDSEISVYSYIPLIPALVFMLSHLFLMMRNALGKELLFAGILVSSLYFCYSLIFQIYLSFPIPWQKWQSYTLKVPSQNWQAEAHPRQNLLQDKSILVMGNDLGAYLGARVASPYLNWRLAQRDINKMDEYFDVQTEVLRNIFDMPSLEKAPEYIVDADGSAKKLFQQLPLVKTYYQKIPDSNLYQLSTKNK